MASKSLNLFLLLIAMYTFSSCTGQRKTETNESQTKISLLGELVTSLDQKIWYVFHDRNDHYWFGSNGNGVFYYNGLQLIRYSTEDGLVDNTIRGIQEDHLGNIYIETPKGISKYDGSHFTTLKLINTRSNNWKLEPNDLWFNCNGNPNDVYRYDGDSLFELALPRINLNEKFGRIVSGLSFKDMNHSPYSVFGIDKDKEGNLWIGTVVAGAYRYDGKSFLWFGEKELSTLPDGRVPGVRSIIQDKNGYFWLSNFISKYRISVKDSKTTYEKLKGIDTTIGDLQKHLPYFNSGLSDHNANLWMTTYTGGVWKYNGKKLLNFPNSDLLLISIYQDNKGIIWLGTDNDGVYTFDGETYVKFEPTLE